MVVAYQATRLSPPCLKAGALSREMLVDRVGVARVCRAAWAVDPQLTPCDECVQRPPKAVVFAGHLPPKKTTPSKILAFIPLPQGRGMKASPVQWPLLLPVR